MAKTTMTSLEKIVFILEHENDLTKEDLVYIHNIMVAKMKAKRNVAAAVIKSKLEVGMAVEWTGRKGTRQGHIEKVNRTKAVVVDDITNVRWNIPMSMLKIIK